MNEEINNLLNVEGVEGVILTSKDGLFIKGNVEKVNEDVVSAIISAIIGGAGELGNVINDNVKYVIIGGDSSKIMLFNCGEKIVGVIGNVLLEDIKDKVLTLFS
ncbi:Roadblock/LC7 family protein [Methanocaldococcus vulcanius M7]|uniref:Roadblock/LC7 family protein n=1 Tax=Methanocaldococcus vulcanius (strain ATCC 700851 / DSM 12094 / M7) TaxID=579137 RepID=C9RI62_METVM|nr:roadblock/LC7 domain-containing protein [Methanocaldococcus vulcanius]ACX73264.1 Roadblock/LC7 family protein [Methanocaldococcus vulcanius M7]